MGVGEGEDEAALHVDVLPARRPRTHSIPAKRAVVDGFDDNLLLGSLV